MTRVFTVFGLISALFFGLPAVASETWPSVGEVEYFSPAMDRLLPPGTLPERLTEDTFTWSEGPVWVPDGGYVIFSDVPANTAWKWSEAAGLEVFMQPSSYQDGSERDPRNPGTNGLVLSLEGKLLAADHGSRSVVQVDLQTMDAKPLVAEYDGKRFNSPNDLAVSRVRWPGTLFFTDPPYGLKNQDKSDLKEIDFNGIYRLDPNGEVTLLDGSMSRPNGIGLSPDEKTLYVASSDRENLVLMAWDLDENGDVGGEPRVFASTMKWHDAGDPGSNDGFAVDTEGNVWATGPGGVFVISPQGEFLGRIKTGTRAANCAFGGPDGQTLYITSHKFLARIKTNARGVEYKSQ